MSTAIPVAFAILIVSVLVLVLQSVELKNLLAWRCHDATHARRTNLIHLKPVNFSAPVQLQKPGRPDAKARLKNIYEPGFLRNSKEARAKGMQTHGVLAFSSQTRKQPPSKSKCFGQEARRRRQFGFTSRAGGMVEGYKHLAKVEVQGQTMSRAASRTCAGVKRHIYVHTVRILLLAALHALYTLVDS